MITENTLKVTDILYRNITYDTDSHTLFELLTKYIQKKCYYGLNSNAFQINQTDENRVKSRLSLVNKV